MSTISSIGIRIGVIVKDVTTPITRLERQLSRLQLITTSLNAAWKQGVLGANQIADGFNSIYNGAMKAYEGYRLIRQGMRLVDNAGLMASLTTTAPRMSGIFGTVIRKAVAGMKVSRGSLSTLVSGVFGSVMTGGVSNDIVMASHGGRSIIARMTDDMKNVFMSFRNIEGGNPYEHIGKSLQGSSLGMAHGFKELIRKLGSQGLGIEYEADSRRHGVYERLMKSLGFTGKMIGPDHFQWTPPQVSMARSAGRLVRAAAADPLGFSRAAISNTMQLAQQLKDEGFLALQMAATQAWMGVKLLFSGIVNLGGAALTVVGALGTAFLVTGAIAGGVLIAVGAGLFYLVSQAIEGQARIAIMGRQFGVSFNNMKGFLDVTQQSHIPTNTAERWLQHLQDLLGGVVNGNSQAIRSFRMLGLNGQALAAMNLSDAFFAIIQRLRQIPNHYERARIAAVLFERNHRAVLDIAANPLVTDSAGAQSQLHARGQTMTQDELARLMEADQALHRLRATWDGIATQLAVRLSPLVIGIVNALEQWIVKSGGVRVAMRDMLGGVNTGFEALAITLGVIVNAFELMYIGVWGIARAAAWLAEMNPVAEVSERGQTIGAAMDRHMDWLSTQHARQGGMLGTQIMNIGAAAIASQGGNWWRNAMAPGSGSGVTMGADGIPHLESAIRNLTDSLNRLRSMPMMMKFDDDMRAIAEGMRVNLLSPGEAALAQADRLDQLEKDLGGGQTQSPSLLDARSQAASSLVADIYNRRDRDDPQQRVVQLLEEARERDIRRTEYARLVALALGRARPLNLGGAP